MFLKKIFSKIETNIFQPYFLFSLKMKTDNAEIKCPLIVLPCLSSFGVIRLRSYVCEYSEFYSDILIWDCGLQIIPVCNF